MDNPGWIKLHRNLRKWEWYTDSSVKSVFIELLLTANHVDKKWRGLTIKRGQLITGRIKLSAYLGLSERQVRTALKKLQSTNEITIKTTNKYSIVTINNYESYQERENNKDQPDGQQKTNERPTKDQPDGQQKTTTKNDKEEKNEKNINNNMDNFEIFWKLYKKSDNKENARKHWKRLTLKEMYSAIEKAPLFVLKHPDKKYRKTGDKYLRDKNWNDDFININGDNKNGKPKRVLGKRSF